VAAEKDDPGVLGNLPRSRPGRRSDKRGTGAKKQPAAGGTAKRGSTQARAAATSQRAKRPAGAKSTARSTAARPKAEQRPPQPTAPPRDSGGDDPLTQAVRLGGKVVETGVKTGVGILKRITGR
jgi:hypothetical protein